jgi:hypothetical protein
MYLRYYNMTEMPFALLPDTNFFYESDSYKEALNVLWLRFVRAKASLRSLAKWAPARPCCAASC